MSTTAAKAAVQPLARIESHYKTFLARRWFALTWRAAVLSSLVTGATILLASAFFDGALVGGIAFPFSTYPILWAKRSLITSPVRLPARNGSFGILVSSLISPRLSHLFVSYIAAGTLLAITYSFTLGFFRATAELGIWTPTPRHPWHLNERLLFLVLGNSLLFLILGLLDVLGDANRPVWPKTKIPFTRAVQQTLLNNLPTLDCWNTVTISQAWLLLYPAIYFVGRRWLWRFLATHFAGLLRPFIINFAKSSRNTVTWTLLPHLLLLEMMSLAAVAGPVAVLQPYVTQPLVVDSFTRKGPLTPDRYLLTALHSQNQYYLNLTLMELERVSHNPARRKAIFEDISKSPTLTNELWQELLLILGRNYRTLATRNASAAHPAPVSRTASQPDPRAIPIKQADIFRPVTKSRSTFGLALQNVLDGPVKAVPPAPVIKATQAAYVARDRAIKGAEDVQAQVMSRIEGTQVGHTVIDEAKGWLTRIHAWTGRSWAQRRVEMALPEVEQAIRVIDVTLAVASLDEDNYGYVQQVLPATLEAIVRFRSALVGFENELLMQAGTLGRTQASAGEEAKRLLSPAIGAAEDAIKRIAERFGTSLAAFRFPPSIGHSLAEICRAGS